MFAVRRAMVNSHGANRSGGRRRGSDQFSQGSPISERRAHDQQRVTSS
jgi:hypothetical protein